MYSKCIVFTGPSGSGKSTIIKGILSKIPNASLSVSCTTRSMRDGEINGQDYYFISKDKFQQNINDRLFIEYTECYGNYYGTLKSEIDRCLTKHKHCIMDLDYPGAKNVMECLGQQYKVVGVLVLPPSITSLSRRLQNRMSETDQSLNMRINQSFSSNTIARYDIIIVNKFVDESIATCISLFE